MLLAIAANEESAAGRLLAEARFHPGGPAAPAGGGPAPATASGRAGTTTPTLDQYGQDLTLKPALARGELHVIGATTLDEYRRHIEAEPHSPPLPAGSCPSPPARTRSTRRST